ncbi:glucosaminidase domain-containing protein [Candidatus Enterococcus ferrettii]|uniref:Mannosyl-glycoprotein endo-beta-N-acetylglucosamidase-like domain-containing protein n=1 Tax=Candidatus Enterococcus ferrettii TaxID=2815324 RepID=A0ABV0EVV7_9ENTE|nr:glucosaminidase domain-containing protein [Enterococcus sp. 665A]MBO1342878.1 glucosaminidase domain-containing protein [Enterococcus sp. 665A]
MKNNLLLAGLCGLLVISLFSQPISQGLSAKTVDSTVRQEAIKGPVSSTVSTEAPASSPLPESSSASVESSQSTESSSSTTSSEEPIIEEPVIEEAPLQESAAQLEVPSIQQEQSLIQPQNTLEQVEENYQFSVVKNQTTKEFIASIGNDAQEIAWKEGLYASVMIAQAILETGSGNSKLARSPHHNLFGIKGSYKGKQVNFATQEDNGSGQLYTINSGFRQYPSYKESLEDYAALLKKGLSGNPYFYKGTWKESAATYQEATAFLTGKYATDTSYNKKLNALIETYELTTFDQELKQEKENEKARSPKTYSVSLEKQMDESEKVLPRKSISSTKSENENKNIAQMPAKQIDAGQRFK